MKIIFCVVLYNRQIEESETINTIKKYANRFSQGTDLTIYVHNNGPKPIGSEPSLPQNIDYKLYEILSNTSHRKHTTNA